MLYTEVHTYLLVMYLSLWKAQRHRLTRVGVVSQSTSFVSQALGQYRNLTDPARIVMLYVSAFCSMLHDFAVMTSSTSRIAHDIYQVG